MRDARAPQRPRGRTRSLAAAGAMLLATASMAGSVANAQSPSTAGTGSSGHLVIADTAERTVYVASVPDGAIVATIPGVAFADHAGFLPLPGGRVLFTTSGDRPELLELTIGDAGATLTNRAVLPTGPIHLSVDPSLGHAAVSGIVEAPAAGTPNGVMTLIDLGTWQTTSLPVATGEPGVILTDSLLLHRNDAPAQLEAWPLDGIAMGSGTMSGSVPIGAGGHGEAYAPARGEAYVATDDGIDVLDVTTPEPTFRRTFGWDVGDRTGGRAYYLRIATEGDSLVTYVTDRSAEGWGDWTTDAYIADLTSGDTRRVPLGTGLVYRAGIGAGRALFFTQVPVEDPMGDQAHVLDLATGSPTYGQVIASIPLDPLSGQGTAEVSIWEAGEGRIAAVSPDGALGFVTNGGDGTVAVIDMATAAITSRISVPSPLSGGGYLVALQPDMPLIDNIGK